MSIDSPIKYNSDSTLTQTQKDINDDPRYWDWFDAWWAQDFSWEGLAKRKIKGWKDGRTLQDYWREEELEGRLIEFVGRTWTRFHLPPHDLEGNVTEKYGFDEDTWEQEKWKSWFNVVKQKLDDACILDDLLPLDLDDSFPSDVDRKNLLSRAQLTGVSFPAHFNLSIAPQRDNILAKNEIGAINICANWSHFIGSVDFSNNTFWAETDFSNAVFCFADFRKARFGFGTNFSNTLFKSWAAFIEVTFGEITTFDETQFFSEAAFKNATFGTHASFKNAEFAELADFDGVTFNGICEFSDKITDKIITPSRTHIGLHFISAVFLGEVNFSNRIFPESTDFTGAAFKSLAKFHGCKFHSDTTFADAEFALPIYNIIAFGEASADAYQSAFRTLRLHMEKLRNHAQENKFSKLEMQARERRVGSKDVPWWVRWLSRGYGLIADYGQSALRPFLWLIGFYIIASVIYYALAGEWANPGAAMATAFQYSLPPVSTFASQFFAGEVDQSFINALLDHPFLTRLVMVTHGVTSLALVFFLLLALKRRFQIR